LKLALAISSRFSLTLRSALIELSLICAALYASMTCSRSASMERICVRTCFASACLESTVGEAVAPAAKKATAARATRTGTKNDCFGVGRIGTA